MPCSEVEFDFKECSNHKNMVTYDCIDGIVSRIIISYIASGNDIYFAHWSFIPPPFFVLNKSLNLYSKPIVSFNHFPKNVTPENLEDRVQTWLLLL